MKYFLTTMLIFIATFASSQVVNIPDPVFKTWLLGQATINTNGDGEILESEALATDTINRFGATDGIILDFTGIRSFSNLQYLNSGPVNVTSLDFSGMAALKWLGVNNPTSNHTTLNIDGCNNLEYMEIGGTFPSIDLTPKQELESIRITLGDNASFTANGLHNLENVIVGCNYLDHLRNISIKNADSLQAIQFFGNADTIDISNTPQLIVAQILPASDLKAFICRNSGVSSVMITYDQNRPDVEAAIDLTDCLNLSSVYLTHFRPSVMDFSGNPGLKTLRLQYNDMANSLINLKNGTALTTLSDSLPGNVRICADDFEIDSLNSWLLPHPSGNVTISPFCTLFPGGNYNLIRGKVRVDVDHNGCDNNDFGVVSIPVKMTNNTSGEMITVSTNTAGKYYHTPYAGNFTLTPHIAYPYFSIAPLNTQVDFDTANNLIDTADFCVTPSGIHNNLEISMIPVTAARPGFSCHYLLTYKSRSTTTISGDVKLNFDNGKMTFVFSNVATSSQSVGQLVWNYSNLLPFESRTIDVFFAILPPPINNPGDTIYFLSQINPIAGDETIANNSFVLPQRLVASLDPNEKECLQGSKINISTINDYLNYVIHFQNTGTDTAFNIVVTDTLSNNLDWDSFDFMSSSHPVVVKQKGNKIEFDFENIKLPFETINEPATHGFVAYSIKPKSNLVIGDSLNNKASIWFDFNAPVVTNTATTVVTDPSGTLAVKLQYFSLVNKNESNQLVWKASSTTGITDFGIERSNDGIHFTNIGNITATVERCQSPFNFTDQKPFDGKTYYRINIKDANGISFYSKVLVAERTKSGLSIITAVVSNQNNTTLYLNASKQQSVQMKVIAADGRLVYNQTKTIAAGSSTMNLSLKNLSSGIYTLIAYTNDGEIITKRFVK
ncbi:MAG: T9SS type A sorting domain-containing protein [Ferruginibacter sp.]